MSRLTNKPVKKIIIFLLSTIGLSLLLVYLTHSNHTVDVASNPYDLPSFVKQQDYIFVGKVAEEDGHFIDSEPVKLVPSIYKVEVLKNLKGGLLLTKPIKLYRDESAKGDISVEAGGIYLFSAFVSQDTFIGPKGALIT